MATDALELDEADVHDEHPLHAVNFPHLAHPSYYHPNLEDDGLPKIIPSSPSPSACSKHK